MVECEFFYKFVYFCDCNVLIDTWWNVNLLNLRTLPEADSFNRYMVECEYATNKLGIGANACFNRYMVECECT